MNAVALPLTSRSTGAIAVVLLAGVDAPQIIAAIAQSKTAVAIVPGQMLHTTLINASGAALDDALIVRLDADRFELHLHGGVAVVDATLAALQAAGATLIDNLSALAAGLLGRGIEAEIAATLPFTQTLIAAKLIIAQGRHGLFAWAQHWQAWLSDPQHVRQLWRFQTAAQWASARSLALNRLLTPPRVAIVGPPNAGKSTLANALLGRPMSITSNLPGTTRDWVDAQAIFTAGAIEIAVQLIDTAGLRDTPDPLEQQSISRSHEQAQAADVVLFVREASIQPLSQAPLEVSRPQLAVFNKSDTLPAAERARLRAESPRTLLVSAKHHEGLDELMRAVLHQLDLAAVDESEPFAFTSRQRGILEKLSHAADTAACLNLLTELRQAP